MRWLELAITVEPELVEAVQEVFQRFGGSSTVIEQQAPANAEQEPAIDTSRPVTARTYIPVDATTAQKRQDILRGLTLLSLIRLLPAPHERVLDEEEWQDAWKQFFPVVSIGKRVIVKPSWREFTPRPGQVVIELDPGMAFGTGLHPSTQLCIEELELCSMQGQAVLDLGTGSGILALAAARLGAARVLALDTDPTAVRVARENVERNNLAQTITVSEGTLPLDQHAHLPANATFDLIVANLTARAIAQLARPLRDALRVGDRLIAGGIIAERLEEATEALRREGFAITRTRGRQDWHALVAERAPR